VAAYFPVVGADLVPAILVNLDHRVLGLHAPPADRVSAPM
jgi:hypothetical protein